jgi:hypothetical protein
MHSNAQVSIERQEPEWLSVTTLGSDYEEEIDIRSKSGDRRHRRRAFTGEPLEEWKPGPARLTFREGKNMITGTFTLDYINMPLIAAMFFPQQAEQHVKYEKAVVEARAITGRSENVIKRGFARMAKLNDGFWPTHAEWHRRVIYAQWGHRGRLQRLGFAV